MVSMCQRWEGAYLTERHTHTLSVVLQGETHTHTHTHTNVANSSTETKCIKRKSVYSRTLHRLGDA